MKLKVVKQICFSVFVLSIGLTAFLTGATERRAFSFENSHELKLWEFKGGATAKIVSKGATHGSRLIKVELPAGNKIWPGMYWMIPAGSWMEDWSNFDSLKFDFTNPTSTQMGEVIVALFDRPRRKHYVSQNFVSVPANTKTTICLSLDELRGSSRAMDYKKRPGESFNFTQVGEFVICVDGLVEPGEFYVDNIRFEVGNSPRIIRSYAKPSVFSPNKDGWIDSTAVFAEFTKVANWRLQIINKQNKKIIRTWTERGNYLDVSWDATDSIGNLLPGGDYFAEIAVFDSANRKKISDKKQILINIPDHFNLSRGLIRSLWCKLQHSLSLSLSLVNNR